MKISYKFSSNQMNFFFALIHIEILLFNKKNSLKNCKIMLSMIITSNQDKKIVLFKKYPSI